MQLGVAKEFWRLTRFSIVGALATGLYTAAAMIAVEVGGVTPIVGVTIGYCASFLVSYVGHLRLTFAVPGRYRDYGLNFTANSIASFFLSTIVMWMATKIFRVDYKLALILVAIIIPICIYESILGTSASRRYRYNQPATQDHPEIGRCACDVL
jgi:putative flippase GtrA